jgi:hypothetical protein
VTISRSYSICLALLELIKINLVKSFYPVQNQCRRSVSGPFWSDPCPKKWNNLICRSGSGPFWVDPCLKKWNYLNFLLWINAIRIFQATSFDFLIYNFFYNSLQLTYSRKKITSWWKAGSRQKTSGAEAQVKIQYWYHYF